MALEKAHLLRRFWRMPATDTSPSQNPETMMVNCGLCGKPLLMRLEDICGWTVECENCRRKLDGYRVCQRIEDSSAPVKAIGSIQLTVRELDSRDRSFRERVPPPDPLRLLGDRR